MPWSNLEEQEEFPWRSKTWESTGVNQAKMVCEEALQAEATVWAQDLGEKDRGKFLNLTEDHMPVAVSLSGKDEAREMDKGQTKFYDLGFILKHWEAFEDVQLRVERLGWGVVGDTIRLVF